MKKILGLTLMLMFIASNCLAMTFYQPVKIGHAGHYKDTDEGGFVFKGTSYNDGNIIKSNNDEYGKGLAHWGNGKDALYCEYDSYLSSTRDDRLKFGGKNNFVVQEMTGRDILKIKSDEGLTIYVLYRQFMYFAYLDIIGCRPDGTWVNYINFKKLEKQFFEEVSKKYMIDLAYGNHGNKLEYYYDGDFIYTKDDTIVVLYSLWKGWDRLQKGEFRFKWDESAQWFGVEQIVYDNLNDEESAKMYLEQGEIYYKSGKQEKALENYDKAIALNSYLDDAYIARSVVCYVASRTWGGKSYYDRAIIDINRALEINPDSARAYRWRGEMKLNGDKATLDDFNKAIELAPNYLDAYESRAKFYMSQKNFDNAIDDYSKVINSPMLKTSYMQHYDFDMMSDWAWYIDLDQRLAHLYNQRGNAYYLKGDKANAIEDYRRALNLSPKNMWIGRLIRKDKPEALE